MPRCISGHFYIKVKIALRFGYREAANSLAACVSGFSIVDPKIQGHAVVSNLHGAIGAGNGS
jgi:hypothetical protein